MAEEEHAPASHGREDENILVVLTHLHRDLSRIYAKRVGMSFSRILFLHELWHAGEISQTELANRLGMEGALLTRFAKSMEADGWISRRTDPRDNRFTLVSITPEGRRHFDEMGIHGKSFLAEMTDDLSEEEVVNTVRTLQKIQDRIAQSLACCD